MGAIKETATNVVDALRHSPVALALVVVNVLYLAAGGWFLAVVAERAEQRDALLVKLVVRECLPATRRE